MKNLLRVGRTEPEQEKTPIETPEVQGGPSEEIPLVVSPLKSVPPETRTKHRHDKGKSPSTLAATSTPPTSSKPDREMTPTTAHPPKVLRS